MKITYLFDPLCGWCYGAIPAIHRLAAMPEFVVNVAPTGLFAGPSARLMDKDFASYAWNTDQRIGRMSGQPFTEIYKRQVLGATGSLFDSAPATLGVVATAVYAPGRELDALAHIQHARYEHGQDIADRENIARIITEIGLEHVADHLRDPDEGLLLEYRQKIDDARQLMRRFNLQGVPALIVDNGVDMQPLSSSALFGGHEQLAAAIRAA